MSNVIAFFDSGVGGLSVVKDFVRLYPEYDFDYYADSLFCPYGGKTNQEIIDRAVKITELFILRGAKLIIVACNTATAVAIKTLRKRFKDTLFVGMEPAVTPAVKGSKTKKIGVLATASTIKSDYFNNHIAKYKPEYEFIVRAGDGLVEIVENLEMTSAKAKMLLNRYLSEMVEFGVDHIVLGCTHYPFFMKEIREIIPMNVEIVSPTVAVSNQIKRQIDALGIEPFDSMKEKDNNKRDEDRTLNFITSFKDCVRLEKIVKLVIPKERKIAFYPNIIA